MTEEWNEIDNPPIKSGWYRVKLRSGDEFEAPFVQNARGKLTWVLPDPTQIIAWTSK